MEQPRVIQATFSDWRTVKGRKQLQLILEVPLEKQGEVLTMLGAPDPANPTWCAVAVLDLKRPVAQRTEHKTPTLEAAGSTPAGPAKERRPFDTLPLSQQCAITCNDRNFIEYMTHHFWNTTIENPTPDDAARLVRDHLGIKSRSELDDNLKARQKWRELNDLYQNWLTDRMYPAEARR